MLFTGGQDYEDRSQYFVHYVVRVWREGRWGGGGGLQEVICTLDSSFMLEGRFYNGQCTSLKQGMEPPGCKGSPPPPFPQEETKVFQTGSCCGIPNASGDNDVNGGRRTRRGPHTWWAWVWRWHLRFWRLARRSKPTASCLPTRTQGWMRGAGTGCGRLPGSCATTSGCMPGSTKNTETPNARFQVQQPHFQCL